MIMASCRTNTSFLSSTFSGNICPARIVSHLSIILLLFIQFSWQQKDPLNDFCRRFGQQSAVIDDKLYLDGGLVNWNPISSNPANYSNAFLLYNDLSLVSSEGEPPLYANLSKNGSIPDLVGGTLWADNVNKRFYLFGGEYYQTPPSDYKLLSYDAIYDQWESFGAPSVSVNAVAWGAGVSISERGEGYYFGGWTSNTTTPGYTGNPVATNSLIKYNMDTNVWTQSSGPDTMLRAEGVMVYLPASDRGLLVYFGGILQSNGSSPIMGSPMSNIYIYDLASSTWYIQNATGDVPEMRRRFCAGATWAEDQSSYNIYLYGGAGIASNTTGFDDVYILSLPSFTWIKWYPTTPGPGKPHHSMTCNVINGAQMLIIGGTFPLSDLCDAPNVYGTHSLDLGKQNPDNAIWYGYRNNITSYVVPDEIIAKVGGNGQGGATITAPAAWSNRDLPVYFTRKATIAARTATRSVTASTPTSTPTNTHSASSSPTLSIGAIVGIAVGGAAVFIVFIALLCLCLRRRYRRQAKTTPIQPHYHAPLGYYQYPQVQHPPLPPQEMDTIQHELPGHQPQAVYPSEPKYNLAPTSSREIRNGSISMPGYNSQTFDGSYSQHSHSPMGSPHPSQYSPHPSHHSPQMATISPASPQEMAASRPQVQIYPSYTSNISNEQRPSSRGRKGSYPQQFR